jgi:hypothetical protein
VGAHPELKTENFFTFQFRLLAFSATGRVWQDCEKSDEMPAIRRRMKQPIARHRIHTRV